MSEPGYSLDDLERLLGVPGRTIRYWAYEGLFQGPGAGRGTRYSDEHLARLFLIQRLRAEGRPIPEIKAAIRRLSATDLRALSEQAKAEPPKPAADAKHLIRRWLSDGIQREPPAVMESRADAAAPDAAIARHAAAGSHWRRIPLSAGVELHVQHPLSQRSQELVDRLVDLSRRLSKEDTR